MAVPQVAVILLLARWGLPVQAVMIAALLAGQGWLMVRLVAEPRERAGWYNATGTSLYVLGMLVAAFGLRALVQA
jgi:chlorophyll synthase